MTHIRQFPWAARAPGTLPSGVEPLIFLDFKNEVYTVEDVVTPIAEILAEELSEGGYGPYSAADITPGTGLVGPAGSSYPSFIGAAETLILDGSTCVYSIKLAADQRILVELIEWAASGTYYYSIASAVSGAPGSSSLGDNSAQVNGDVLAASTLHKIALTFIEGKITRSTNGAAIQTLNPADAWTPTPNLMVLTVEVGCIIEQIGMYPAQDDADLPGLSAL